MLCTLFLVLGLAVGASLGAEAPIDYSTVNSILAQVQLTIDTSALPDTTQDGVSTVFGDEGTCTGFQIGKFEVENIVGAVPFELEGESFEFLDIKLRAAGLEFSCEIPLQVTFDPLFLPPQTANSVFAVSAGKVGSDPGLNFQFGTRLLSPNFSSSVPTKATRVPSLESCSDKIDLSGLRVTVTNLINPLVDGITSGIIQLLLPALTEPLEEAACEAFDNITDELGELAVNNAVANFLRGPESPSAVLALEMSLNPGPGVDLVDWREVEAEFGGGASLFDLLLLDLPTTELTGLFESLNITVPENFNSTNAISTLELISFILEQGGGVEAVPQALVDVLLFALGIDTTGPGAGVGEFDAEDVLQLLDQFLGLNASNALQVTPNSTVNDISTEEFIEFLDEALSLNISNTLNVTEFVENAGPTIGDLDGTELVDLLEIAFPGTNVSGFFEPGSIASGSPVLDNTGLFELTDLLLGSAVNLTELFNITEDGAVIGVNAAELIQLLDTVPGLTFVPSDLIMVDVNGNFQVDGDEVLFLADEVLVFNVSDVVSSAALELVLEAVLNGNTTEIEDLISDLVEANFEIPGFGSLFINSTAFSAELNASSADLLASGLEAIGGQTVALPGNGVGDLRVFVGFNISADINSTAFAAFGLPLLDLEFTDQFDFEFSWTEVLIVTVVLLAFDGNVIGNIELGPLLERVADCILSGLFTDPQIAGIEIKSDRADLQISGAVDAITRLFTDTLNSVFLAYEGSIPEAVSRYGIAALQGQPLLPEAEYLCDPFPQTEENINTPFLFNGSNPLSRAVNASIPLLTTLLTEEAVLLDEPATILNVKLNDDSEPFQLVVSDVMIRRSSSQWLKTFSFFSVKDETPQLLETAISTEPFEITAKIDFETGLVRRRNLQASNSLTLTWSFQEGVEFDFDILATLSVYAVNSMPLSEILIPECWTARFAPYGGLKQLTTQFNLMDAQLICESCETDLILEITDILGVPGSEAAQEFLALLQETVKTILNQAVSRFEPENWEATIAEAERSCAAGGAPSDNDLEPASGAPSNLSGAYTTLGIFATALSVAGAAVLFPSFRRARQNAAALNAVVVAEPVSEDETAEDVTESALWKHKLIPRWWRICIPILIVLNAALFVVGHVDFVIQIDIVGTLFDGAIDINVEEFSGFSVISSTQRLWKDGARVLAAVIFLFSIIWPYVKLVGISLCWLLPTTWLSFKQRGGIILALDRLGKWTFLELYFIAFLLIGLEVQVDSPSDTAPGLYELLVQVLPQVNLYTFTTALILSLFVSNVVLFYHERIEEAAFDNPADSAEALEFGNRGKVFLISMVFTGSLLIIGSTLSVISLEALGIVPALAEAGGISTEQEFSLFNFFLQTFQGSSGGVYFGFVLFITVFMIPLAQMVLLGFVSVRELTLHRAVRLRELNHVLCAWSGIEVFLLGIILATIEIGTVSRTLLQTECEELLPVVSLIASFNILSDDDVLAGCYEIRGRLEVGAYLFLVVIIAHNVLHFLVSDQLNKFVSRSREVDNSPGGTKTATIKADL